MTQHNQHFTVSEARALLPDLKERLLRIRALFTEMQQLAHEFELARKRIQANGHAQREPQIEAASAELEKLVKSILELGVQIKDPVRGLVDFPHMRNGEEVYLCWEADEDDISYWHRIEDGYSGREPLDAGA